MLADCTPLTGDSLTATVHWGDSSNLNSFAGKSVRLKFALRDAELFSFRFE
jgi:hypothetical protein